MVRKPFGREFKTKVARKVLRGEKTVAQLLSCYVCMRYKSTRAKKQALKKLPEPVSLLNFSRRLPDLIRWADGAHVTTVYFMPEGAHRNWSGVAS